MVEKEGRGAINRALTGYKKVINLPLTDENVLSLKAGDIVSLNSAVVTGRDMVHKYLVENKPRKEDIPFDKTGALLPANYLLLTTFIRRSK